MITSPVNLHIIVIHCPPEHLELDMTFNSGLKAGNVLDLVFSWPSPAVAISPPFRSSHYILHIRHPCFACHQLFIPLSAISPSSLAYHNLITLLHPNSSSVPLEWAHKTDKIFPSLFNPSPPPSPSFLTLPLTLMRTWAKSANPSLLPQFLHSMIILIFCFPCHFFSSFCKRDPAIPLSTH